MSVSGQQQESEVDALSNQLQIEIRIRNGAEHLLSVFDAEAADGVQPAPGHTEALKQQVEEELQTAQAKIRDLERRIQLVTLPPQQQEQQRGEGSVAAGLSVPVTPQDDDSASFHDASESFIDSIDENPIDRGAAGPALDWLERVRSHKNDLVRTASTELLQALEGFSALMLSQPPLAHVTSPVVVQEVLLPLIGDDWHRDVRATAHQAIRYWCCTFFEGVQHLRDHHFDWYLIRSLTRDHKCDLEKQQALLTIRSLIQLTHVSGVPLVAAGVVRAIVALAENGEDKLRYVALETLCELAIRDVALLDSADGLRTLLHALMDGPFELAPSIAQVLVYLVDRPHLRAYFRSGVDLDMAFSGLTVGFAKGAAQEERMRSSARVIVLLLKSWSGLIYTCSNNMRTLQSLVGALSAPTVIIQETVLDTLFEVFRIETPEWLNPFVAGKRLTLFRRDPAANATNQEAPQDQGLNGGTFNLIDQWLRIVLWAFLRCGLIEALVRVVEQQSNPQLGRKAAVLLGEVLQLSSRLLPAESPATLALPRLFTLATDYGNDMPWFAATSALGSVDSVGRKLRKTVPQQGRRPEIRTRSNSLEVESSKVRMGMAIDDANFRDLLVETQVLTSKDYTRWNFDVLRDLLEGPLMNPKRMEEVLKGSKLMRRILTFFHPHEHLYSTLPRTPTNACYTQFACTLITTLLASAEGIRFLAEDKLLRQITDGLMALENAPSSAVSMVGENTFSKPRVASTLVPGYFEMLGTLTKYQEGLQLLEKFRCFTSLYRLADMEDREDLVRLILDNFDYSFDGHSRIILAKVLTYGPDHMRLYATQRLARLIQTQPPPVFWLIKLLVTQLYDTYAEVRNLTVQILEEACQSTEVLEAVVELRPSLDHLGYAGAPLLFLFMSTSLGLSYLNELKYVEQSMEEWYLERNEQYVVQVETHLARLLNVDGGRLEEDNLKTSLSGVIPPHFYGELVKTPEGCLFLEESGHFLDFADYIRDHGLEYQDLENLGRLKSILWAVGHIGASPGGLPFLEAESIIPTIVEIAASSLCLSIRGMCCFVLGLISSTAQGSDILDELGWHGPSFQSADTRPGGCCPSDASALFNLPSAKDDELNPPLQALPPPESTVERQICIAITNLSNHILATAASKTLSKIKTRSPHAFQNPSLFFRALYMLDHNHFRLPVRRYILDLFPMPFTPAHLDEAFEEGARLQAQSGPPKGGNGNAVLTGSPQKRKSTIMSGNHLAWPSGQSSMLRAGMWSDEEEEDEVDEDTLPPKQTLQPVVTIEGFLC